jgi:PAS domain S-box-containing protein
MWRAGREVPSVPDGRQHASMLEYTARRYRSAVAIGFGLTGFGVATYLAAMQIAAAKLSSWVIALTAGIGGAAIGIWVAIAVIGGFFLPLPRGLARRWYWMQLVVERTHSVVIVTDRPGRIVEVNPAFERQTGYTLDEARGRTPGRLLQGPLTDAATVKRMSLAVAQGHPFSEEVVNYDRWGRTYSARIDVEPIHDAAANVVGFVSTQTDVTVLKDLVEEKQRAYDAANHANQVKSEFLAGMSHELRTPLNAILGFAEMMQSEVLGPVPPQYRDYVQNIHSSGDRLLTLISNMLDLLSLEENAFVVRLEEVDLKPVVTEIVDGLRPKAEAADVQLHVGFETESTTSVVDPQALARAFENVVLNAIQFTPRGGVVRVALSASARGAMLEVRDSGIGIAQDRLDEVQEPFNAVSGYARKPLAGAGIGLPISRRLVEVQGGRLSVQSEVGRGTVVRIELPRQDAA